MELIGKKMVRKTAFETSNEPKLTVTSKKTGGKLGLTGAAMRKINLYNKEIGIAYDGPKAFLYITEEGGNKVKDNGAISSTYHAKRLLSTFNAQGEKAVFDISTTPQVFAEQGDIQFFEITSAIDIPTMQSGETVPSEVTESIDDQVDMSSENYFPENDVVDDERLGANAEAQLVGDDSALDTQEQ